MGFSRLEYTLPFVSVLSPHSSRFCLLSLSIHNLQHRVAMQPHALRLYRRSQLTCQMNSVRAAAK